MRKEINLFYYRADSEQGEAQFVAGKIKELTQRWQVQAIPILQSFTGRMPSHV